MPFLIFAAMNVPGKQQIFSINSDTGFNAAALQIFRHQAANCNVYREFIHNLQIDPLKIDSIAQIPFLPISFFKSHTILSTNEPVQTTFSSSGTTGSINSKHPVTDLGWYEQSFGKGFEMFYGDIRKYCVLALLPSYLEREGSSLIYMAEDLVKNSKNPDSGFYLYEHEDLYDKLKKQQASGKPTLLLGVTFALLDFIESYQINFPELLVMETGGMKGRRKEMVREELHQRLCNGFGVNTIHSEYGMTEMLSQAYSPGHGIFHSPPWLKILTRDTNDPMTLLQINQTGGVNVIDLANINSCSFLATQDLGKIYADGSFEVLGRFDNSDIRGCNLLVAD